MENIKTKKEIYYYPYESIYYRQWASIDVAVERLEKGIDGPNATVYTSYKEAREAANAMLWELIDASVICIEIEGEKCFARKLEDAQNRIELSANVRTRIKVVNNAEEVYFYPIPHDEEHEYEDLERGIKFLQQKGEQIEVYRDYADAIRAYGDKDNEHCRVLRIEKTKEKCIAFTHYKEVVELGTDIISRIKVIESPEQTKARKR